MGYDVRTIGSDELLPFVGALSTGFFEPLDVAAIAEAMRPIWDLDRAWAAFEDGRIVGTLRTWATELTVPGGGRLPGAAMAAVSVRPTHRRRGIMRALAAAEHRALRERGEVVGLLHASEYPIYGRFGYGPATREVTVALDTRATDFVTTPVGSVEIVDASEVTRDVLKDVFETWRCREPASLRRRDAVWDFELGLRPDPWVEGWKGFLSLHRDTAGVVDGYTRYSRAEDRWEHHQPRNVLRVDELVALTDAAHADLWRSLAEYDWVGSIRAEHRSLRERLPWLITNARAVSFEDVADDLWVRLFDIPRALATRTYHGEGSVVLEVIDAEATGGRTRVRLEAGPDGAACATTDTEPDLTLDVATLGAIYLGWPSVRDAMIRFGGEAHHERAVAEVDRLFRSADEPWCTTFF